MKHTLTNQQTGNPAYKAEIIHKRINPADFNHDTDPIETELLKWFWLMPKREQNDLLEEARLIGYSNMIAMRNDAERSVS